MVAGQNWKSRAESMLSNFIDGDVQDPYYYSQMMENSSTPNNDHASSSSSSSSSSCANNHDSVYDRMLGCGSNNNIGVGSGGGGGGPCVSLFLQWVKVVLGRTTRAYLSSPICLALLPLVLGVGFGFWMGRRRGSGGGSTIISDEPRKQSKGMGVTSLGRVISHIYHWLRLQAMLMLCKSSIISSDGDSNLFQEERDEHTRAELQAMESKRESGVDPQCVPRHIAVIMDGNRRYGKAKYGNATRGHWDGSKTLIEFSKWCISEGIQILTVYAFSTENWDRDPAEVSALMTIFCKYCDELRVEAIQRGIRIRVLSTEEERIPVDVKVGIDRMVLETMHCDKFTMNICLSYGGRGEIVNACKSIAMDVQSGKLSVDEVGEREVHNKMLTEHCCDPDIIIRTSGEERLSNFLLWQVAYSEFFFLEKQWPELEKEDLLGVIRTFARGRKRRYGK
ncbi:hypothetical protein ACHAXR_005694 [Thalassiosira sp. AJA248-18]